MKKISDLDSMFEPNQSSPNYAEMIQSNVLGLDDNAHQIVEMRLLERLTYCEISTKLSIPKLLVIKYWNESALKLKELEHIEIS